MSPRWLIHQSRCSALFPQTLVWWRFLPGWLRWKQYKRFRETIENKFSVVGNQKQMGRSHGLKKRGTITAATSREGYKVLRELKNYVGWLCKVVFQEMKTWIKCQGCHAFLWVDISTMSVLITQQLKRSLICHPWEPFNILTPPKWA